jgi:HSF-type DNA-binding
MLMLTYAERDYSPPENGNDVDREAAVGWTLDGRAFIIRNKDDLVKGLLPMFFRQGKLASFTRKLYRWGFRQVSVSPDGLSSKKKMIFGHEWFQRDNKQLMASMRSITAAGTRRRALGSSKQKSKSASERNVVLEPKVLIPNTVHTQFMLLPAMSSSTPGPSGPMSASFVYKATGGTTPHTSQQMMTTNSILGNMISRPPATMASTPFLLQGHNAPLVSRIQHQGDEQAGMHPMAGGNGYLTSLAHLGAQGRTFQDLQGQPMDGSDPNAYMRAAIDMLLRHASTNSTSTNDRNAG